MDGNGTAKGHYQRLAGILSAEAERLLRWAQGLPDLARFEAGGEEADRNDVDLNALLEQCCETLWPRAQSAGVALQVQRPRQALPVRGDAKRLSQALTNVLDNALAHAGATSRVQVKAALGGVRGSGAGSGRNSHAPADGGRLGRWWVEVNVTVDAPGVIEPATASRPEPARGVNRSRSNGTSTVDLATVREIVIAHGGELLTQITAGGGSEVTLRLPMRVSN